MSMDKVAIYRLNISDRNKAKELLALVDKLNEETFQKIKDQLPKKGVIDASTLDTYVDPPIAKYHSKFSNLFGENGITLKEVELFLEVYGSLIENDKLQVSKTLSSKEEAKQFGHLLKRLNPGKIDVMFTNNNGIENFEM